MLPSVKLSTAAATFAWDCRDVIGHMEPIRIKELFCIEIFDLVEKQFKSRTIQVYIRLYTSHSQQQQLRVKQNMFEFHNFVVLVVMETCSHISPGCIINNNYIIYKLTEFSLANIRKSFVVKRMLLKIINHSYYIIIIIIIIIIESRWPVLLFPVLTSGSAVLLAQKAWHFWVDFLLTKHHTDDFKVSTYSPVTFCTSDLVQNLLKIFAGFL